MKPATILRVFALTVLLPVAMYAQVPVAPDNAIANTDMNWIQSRVFIPNGAIIKEKKTFYNATGKMLQSQQKVFSATNDLLQVNRPHVLASQPIYDMLGRPSVNTLPAPINSRAFEYRSNFASGYNYNNFDGSKTNNPDPVTDGGTGTLGWYYGQNNTWEKYQDASSYPYARNDYYKDGTGEIKRATGPGDKFRMGQGKEVAAFTVPVGSELANYLAVRNAFFSAESGALPTDLNQNAIETIGRDENGKELVEITDKMGNVLMTARPGNDLIAANQVKISLSGKYSAIINGRSSTDINPSATVTWLGMTAQYSYLLPIIHLFADIDSPIESDNPFNYTYCTRVRFTITCQPPAAAAGSRLQVYYFKILADNTLVNIGGDFTLYDMSTGSAMPFSGSDNLNRGYYKVIANSGDVTLSYSNSYSDISYTFYNQLGQLIATISPEGVKKLINGGYSNYTTKNDLPFTTLYTYDLQGHLMNAKSADTKEIDFVYRKDGKIRFSQNAEQRKQGMGWYSYTNYDEIGRPVESGEFHPGSGDVIFNSPAMTAIVEDVSSAGGLPPDYNKRIDWVKTTYDVADNNHGLAGYVQDEYFLRNAVSARENANSKSWYNYDEQGRLVWVVRQVVGLGLKTIDYVYDNQQTNLLQKIIYEKTQPDQFIHYYTYDDDARIKELYTNIIDDPNISNWKLQARYQYYLTGQLKRVELADKLQGLDYTYNIRGALKSINQADYMQDPGNDNLNTNGFQPDAFGMNLEYYAGDYNKTSAVITSYSDPAMSAYAPDQFAGQLRAISWFSQKPSSTGMSASPNMYAFQYDDKYEFSNATWGVPAAPGFTAVPGQYGESIQGYDANGNIKGISRTSTGGMQDNFSNYKYYNSASNTSSTTSYNTNKLMSVDNYATFNYDDLGQLSSGAYNGGASQYVQYDSRGMVTGVYADAGYTQPIVTFVYNEKKQRIIKRTYVQGTANISNALYYVYDDAGNVMGIYTQQNGSGTPLLVEQPIYASSRIGVYFKQTGEYWYELCDNLGNVRSVVKSNGTGLDVVQYSDYYPYGSLLRGAVSGQPYRFGYQGKYSEKDPETGWNAFLLRMYDGKLGRWLSVDPKGEFHSPYIGMGNDPVNKTDPDGGCTSPECRARAYAEKNGGVVRYSAVSGTWGVDMGGGVLKVFKNYDNAYDFSAPFSRYLTRDMISLALKIPGMVSKDGLLTRLRMFYFDYNPKTDDFANGSKWRFLAAMINYTKMISDGMQHKGDLPGSQYWVSPIFREFDKEQIEGDRWGISNEHSYSTAAQLRTAIDSYNKKWSSAVSPINVFYIHKSDIGMFSNDIAFSPAQLQRFASATPYNQVYTNPNDWYMVFYERDLDKNSTLFIDDLGIKRVTTP